MIFIFAFIKVFWLYYNFISSQNVFLKWGEVGCKEPLTGDECAIIKSFCSPEMVLYNSGSNKEFV